MPKLKRKPFAGGRGKHVVVFPGKTVRSMHNLTAQGDKEVSAAEVACNITRSDVFEICTRTKYRAQDLTPLIVAALIAKWNPPKK